jgi:hypothetical protein
VSETQDDGTDPVSETQDDETDPCRKFRRCEPTAGGYAGVAGVAGDRFLNSRKEGGTVPAAIPEFSKGGRDGAGGDS